MSEGWQTLDSGEQPDHMTPPDAHQPTGLRQAREATGLHIAALAAALKVPVKKLEALEAGRYEELPDMTFARALASSACRHLKVDAAPILERIPHAHAPELGAASTSMNTVFKPDHSAASMAVRDGTRNPAVLITSAVLVAALGLAFLPDWQQWPGKGWIDSGVQWVQNVTRVEHKTELVEVGIPAAVPATPALSQTEAPSAENNVQTTEVAAASLKSASELQDAPATSETPSGAVLHLAAVNDSWVEVIDGSGKVQIQRVMKKGDVMDFSSTPPYSVVLGRSDAVTVQVRGQAFDVSPFARNSVARFQVK
jgi:cytoskeleton protein RodZ